MFVTFLILAVIALIAGFFLRLAFWLFLIFALLSLLSYCTSPNAPEVSMKRVIEIRAAEGGEDSKLFVKDLSKAYIALAQRKG